jgi:hypothetical protein
MVDLAAEASRSSRQRSLRFFLSHCRGGITDGCREVGAIAGAARMSNAAAHLAKEALKDGCDVTTRPCPRTTRGALSTPSPSRDGARMPFDGFSSNIEAGRIRDVSLTTRVTQTATLHGVSSLPGRRIKCKRDDNPRHTSQTMKQYKPLLSSAPANSILNAQKFHYRNSANTDIRKTFANFRRNASKQNQPRFATNVRTLTKYPLDATRAPCLLAPLRRSSG